MIVHFSLSQRQPGQVDTVSRAFRSVLGGMMATAYLQGGKTNEVGWLCGYVFFAGFVTHNLLIIDANNVLF